MTTKKTKTTAEKFNEIKLSDVAQADDFVDIHIDVPEDMSEFLINTTKPYCRAFYRFWL